MQRARKPSQPPVAHMSVLSVRLSVDEVAPQLAPVVVGLLVVAAVAVVMVFGVVSGVTQVAVAAAEAALGVGTAAVAQRALAAPMLAVLHRPLTDGFSTHGLCAQIPHQVAAACIQQLRCWRTCLQGKLMIAHGATARCNA